MNFAAQYCAQRMRHFLASGFAPLMPCTRVLRMPSPLAFAALLRMSLVLILLCAAALHAQTYVPYLSGHVNDYANLLSPNTVAELEEELKAHEAATSNQVAVLIVATIGDDVLEEYSMRVVETWKLGRADHDNGVLLLIARNDRKMRIEVGDGLEGSLPDITCGRIIRNEIAPRFKAGDYDNGVRRGVHAILEAIQGTYVASETEESSAPSDWKFRLLFFGIFLFVVGMFTCISLVSSGSAGWFLYFFLIPFWTAFPMISFGLRIGGLILGGYLVIIGLLKLFFEKHQRGRAVRDRWAKSWAAAQATTSNKRGGGWSSGSSWSSSSWSSSSSSSSFSGGGGSFSGGGASGSW